MKKLGCMVYSRKSGEASKEISRTKAQVLKR